MKIVGKHNHTQSISKGKSYDVLTTLHHDSGGYRIPGSTNKLTNSYSYVIINDLGLEERFSSYYFITLEEHRDNLLKEILQ